MPAFTTRVELHNAIWSDYENLHKQMKQQGFSQTIRSDDGIVYELPPAEYDISANITRSDVIKRAKTAVAATSKSGAILITESAGRTWHGLSKA